jgi:predicted DNA-binding antitoxin AbrB/MazE fold protein
MRQRVHPNAKEDIMKRHLLARVEGGNFAPTEPVELPEGMIVELTLETPEPPEARSRAVFRPRKMGVRQPLTREVIYEDVG